MTCPQHAWTLPCLTCHQTKRFTEDRQGRIWILGGLGMDIRAKVETAVHELNALEEASEQLIKSIAHETIAVLKNTTAIGRF